MLESKAGIEGLALNLLIFDLFKPYDFTGKDMKVRIGNKGWYLGLPFLFGGQGKV